MHDQMDSNNEDWLKTMKSELQSMSDNGVWELVELPARCKSISCKWVCETKRRADGERERYIKLIWLQMASLKRKEKTTMRHSHLSQLVILLESGTCCSL